MLLKVAYTNDKFNFTYCQWLRNKRRPLVNPQLNYARPERQIIKDLKLGKLEVFNYLLSLDNVHNSIYVSQDTIASKTNLSRRQVNRILIWLEDNGYISTKFRYMETCLYKISSFFHDIKVRMSLREHIWALHYPRKVLALALLLTSAITSNRAPFKENVTQVKHKRSLYNVHTTIGYITIDSNVPERFQQMNKRVLDTETENLLRGFKFNEDQEMCLSTFSKHTLKIAIGQLKYKGNIYSPFGYLLAACRKIEPKNANRQAMSDNVYYERIAKKPLQKLTVRNERPLSQQDTISGYPTVQQSLKEYYKTQTVTFIANEIAKIMDSKAINNMASFMGMEAAVKVRDDIIKKKLELEYVLEGTPEEEVALLYVNKYRAKFGLESLGQEI